MSLYMSDKKFIVSVGAGLAQEPFIQALAENGFGVIAFGKGRNSETAIKTSDYFAELDTHNYKRAIKWLKSLPVKIFGAGSYAGGGAILTLQHILNEFDLPTRIPESLLIGMNKVEQQEYYHKKGLSGIQTWTKTTFNLQETEADLFIIKPAIGRGSEGVKQMTRAEVVDGLTHLNDKDVIQTFVEGIEYRVLVFIQDFKVKILAPVKRSSFSDTFLLGRLFYSDAHHGQIKYFYSDLCKKLKIRDAIIKSDIIVSDERIDMIEMDIGVGGGLYYKTYISKLMNLNITDQYIRLITGQQVEEVSRTNENLMMDYIFNITGKPIQYDKAELDTFLRNTVGKHYITANFLKPQKHGMCSSNAHFIFTVIHRNNSISNERLNELINKNIFW